MIAAKDAVVIYNELLANNIPVWLTGDGESMLF
jgi:hypothetical protein